MGNNKIEDIHKKYLEEHEKHRQEAMRKFKGKELEDVLKKLDELQKPLVKAYNDYDKVIKRGKITKKQVILIIISIPLFLILIAIVKMCMGSVLYFNDKLNWAACILYPLGVVGFLYIVLKRGHSGVYSTDIKTGASRELPMSIAVLSSFVGGAILPFLMVYVPLSVGMNIFNSHPVKMDSTLVEIKHHHNRYFESTDIYDCRVLAYKKNQGSVSMPTEEDLVLSSIDLEMPLHNGDKIILIGRDSFAGVVIDKIQKAH
jgi:hypothetical protein